MAVPDLPTEHMAVGALHVEHPQSYMSSQLFPELGEDVTYMRCGCDIHEDFFFHMQVYAKGNPLPQWRLGDADS